MKLYFATGSKGYLEFLLMMGVKNILISYAYKEPWACKEVLKHHGIKIMCDSGAFTSWSLAQKKKAEGDANWKNFLVNLDNYMKFIDKNKDIIDRVINLDVIPGKQGEKPTQDDFEQSASEGWENYLIMEKKGYKPVHVFHQGEKLSWLTKMIDHGCDYIGVSPNNDRTDDQKIVFLDDAFRHIRDSSNPKIKTHAFGVTSYKVLKRYPWYSADSSSYSLTAAMGSVLTPYGRIYVSDKNQGDKDHFINKPEVVKKMINNYFKKRIGYDAKSMMMTSHYKQHKCLKCGFEQEIQVTAQAYKARNFANIVYFLDLEKRVNDEGPTHTYDKIVPLL